MRVLAALGAPMHAIFGSIVSVATEISRWSHTQPAHRIAAFGIVFAAYSILGIAFRPQVSWVAAFRKRVDDQARTQDLLGPASIRGPVPTILSTIIEQRTELKSRPWRRCRSVALRTFWLALTGLAAPLAILWVVICLYGTLFPGAKMPLNVTPASAADAPGSMTVANFLGNQAFLATPADTAEIFLNDKIVEWNKSDVFFTFLVWLNRLICEASFAGLIFLSTSALYYAAQHSDAERKRLAALEDSALSNGKQL